MHACCCAFACFAHEASKKSYKLVFGLGTFSVRVLDIPQLSVKIGSCVDEEHLASGRVGSDRVNHEVYAV